MEKQPDIRKSFVDKCVRDRRGKLAIAAVPNLPLLLWLVARGLAWLLHGIAQHITSAVAFGALFTWAWLELVQGVNYFRRALGAVVLVLLVVMTAHA